MGKANAAVGGKPNVPAWLKQKGQCSKCKAFSAGADDLTGSWLSATLMSLEPVIEQISVQDTPKSVVAATAWETDGASDASKIAKHAIHAANCRVALFIPIGGF